MAIELCSGNSAGVSPRISFSHDLCVSDIVPVEQRLPLRSGSLGSIDFDFCVRKSFDSSSADELFSDGKLLPTEIKKKTASAKQMDSRVRIPSRDALQDGVSSDDSLKRECLKEMKSSSYEAEDQKQTSKSFWSFKRSSSLNCASGYGRSLCHLPLLSRSYSTGSTPRSKRAPLTKEINHKQNKQEFFRSSKSTSSTKNYQKPPLKKNYGPYGNGVRVSPVLNVPPGNLFGLGSIFFNGKDKKNMKK
uniref:Uncharacterized protein n=1 Tax=Salix viminalis TaxID=40686 RepID=A0A6N2K952_SALVM